MMEVSARCPLPIWGLTIARSIVWSWQVEDAFIHTTQCPEVSHVWLLCGPYEHHTVPRVQKVYGLDEVFLDSLWVHLLWGEGHGN